MSNNSWYNVGFDEETYESTRAKKSSLWPPNRFFVKAGETPRQIVFVDDEPITFYEHNPTLQNSWQNYSTCLQGVHEDIACCAILGPRDRYYIGYYTIVDCTEWVDKQGVKHQYEVRLFPAKLKTLKNLQRIKDKRGGLSGKLFEASRIDKKSPSVGDTFEFERDVDLANLFKVASIWKRPLTELYAEAPENPKTMEALRSTFQLSYTADTPKQIIPQLFPFNYFEMFQPKSPEEIREFLKNYNPAHARFGSGQPKVDDNVPF